MNLPDSDEPKQSAKDAFYMFAFTHPLKNTFPRRGRIRVQRYEIFFNKARKMRYFSKKITFLQKNNEQKLGHAVALSSMCMGKLQEVGQI